MMSVSGDLTEKKPHSLELVAVHLLNRLLRANASLADQCINETLAMLGEVAGFDRTYLFWMREDQYFDNTHEWTAPGIEPMIDELQGLPVAMYGALWLPIQRDEHVFIENVAEMPDDQSEERNLLSQQGICSLLLVAVVDAGKPVGLVGYDVVGAPRKFVDSDILLLRAVANGIGSLKMRLAADIALRESRDLIAATLDAVPDLIIQVDKNRRIESIHPSANGIEVGAPEDLAGRHLDEVLPPEIAEIAKEMCESVGSTSPSLTRRYPMSFGGQDRWFEARVAEWRNARGGYVFIIRDITNEHLAAQQEEIRIRQLQEIFDLETKLRQSQKMEAIGQLTGGIAHDFNNLMTIILGNAEVLTDVLAEDQKTRRLADSIVVAAERGATLTSRLLSFARLQALEPKHIDPKKLLADIKLLVERTIDENVVIETTVASDAWLIEVDPSQLENAILNLVLNARDAMPDGGRLTINVSNVTLSKEESGSRAGDCGGRWVSIAVSDTGSGMSKEVVERAFDPFFTTKEAGKGTGLGLSMVWGFMQQSNGWAEIDSERGKGTTVKLLFPAAKRQEGALQPTRSAPGALLGGTERILVVEDDEMLRGQVVTQIASLGYDVQQAASAAQALVIIDTNEAFDLLFTDIVMPGGMNGRQLADAALIRQPGLKVLFTSGYTADAIGQKGRLDKGVYLLGKPYRRHELARKIREVLGE